jgi:hypothetical protein
MIRPGISFTLNIRGWHKADNPNDSEAEATLVLAVSSEDVISCGEPTLSARGRSFGGGDAPLRVTYCALADEIFRGGCFGRRLPCVG